MNSLLVPELFGEAGMRFAETVRVLSDGTLTIEFNDRLVLDQDTFAAMDAGVIDVVWGSAGHHHREDPALTLFSGFPFGPDPAAFTAWMRHGGGEEALDAIYARHGLKSVYCGILPAETGGWFRHEIRSLDDLDGLNMRAFGYGGRVLRRLGVVPYEIGADEIVAAFEAGVIDAAEFSLPSIDAGLGIGEVARHLYFPGWQQPVTSLELLMPAETFDALSARHKSVIETACGDSLTWTAAAATMEQIETLEQLRDGGITIHAWPEEVLAALRTAWDAVIAEDAAMDPAIDAAWSDYLRFTHAYQDWEARAYPD